MRRWYRNWKLRKAIKWAEERDCQVLSDEFLLYVYRTLRKQNERLGI